MKNTNYSYYDGLEADVDYWYGRYLELVDSGENDPDVGIVEYIAGKIDEDHPTESPEEFESLMRWVRSVLPNIEKTYTVSWKESTQRGNRMKNIKEDLTVCCSCRGPHPEYAVKEWCSLDNVDTNSFCDYWDLASDDMLCYECYHDKRDEFESEAEDFMPDSLEDEDYDDYDEDHSASFDDEDSPYFMGGGKGW